MWDIIIVNRKTKKREKTDHIFEPEEFFFTQVGQFGYTVFIVSNVSQPHSPISLAGTGRLVNYDRWGFDSS